MHQRGLSIPYCHHRDGTIDRILDGVPSLSMLFCSRDFHLDRGQKILRSPSSQGFDHRQCVQGDVDWLEKWGQHGYVDCRCGVRMPFLFATDNVAEAAKPSYQDELGRKYRTSWDDIYIDELKRGLAACRVFLFYPIYWVAYSQMLNNFISQGEDYPPNFSQVCISLTSRPAGTMQLHGIPNDIMQNIDPFTLIFLIPIFDRLLYPGLRKIGIPFRPITRITWGFVFCAFAMAYAAIVQHVIYSSPPCYDAPLACDPSHLPNQVHVALQTPAYFFVAVSEILASVTGLEYAFTKAPPSMKSFVMSIFLLQSAFGSALGVALAPFAKDPRLVWMYTGLCIATFIAAGLFWVCFQHLNATEDSMNALENKGETAAGVEGLDATGPRDLKIERRIRAATSEAEV